MSTGHDRSGADIDTPHGTVSAPCIVAWVRCDRCGDTLSTVGAVTDDGEALCDDLASDCGWTCDDDCDLCAACCPRGVR